LASEKIYTEQELVCLLKQKDTNAFVYLYDKYSTSFYGMILNHLNQDETIAEGILQDVFLKIWKNVEEYDSSKEALFTWMFKIVASSVKEKVGVMKKISIQLIKNNVGILHKHY
jgi:RNA polymerase sigma-70 factor (ECF subfamily)